MQFRKNRRAERAGVNAAQSFFEEHSWVFQPVDQANDYGKDAYLDVPEGNTVTGLCAALQIKSGKSYRRASGYAIPIEGHERVWRESVLPIIGIVHDPTTKQLFWCDISRFLREHPGELPAAIPVSQANVLNADTLLGDFLDCIRTSALLTLQAMGTLDVTEVVSAAHVYGTDIEEIRGELTDPATWSAPGWRRLSALSAEDLLRLAQAAGNSGQLAGAVAYVRIATLIGSHADVPHLAKLLRGTFSGLNRLAEDTIVCIASIANDANLAFLRQIATHQHPYLRKAAATAIGRVGTCADIAILAELARDEYPHAGVGGDFNVRRAVAGALGRLRCPDGLPILQGMTRDQDGEVLTAVAQAMGNTHDPEALPQLQEAATRFSSWPAQDAAAKAYAQVASGGDLQSLRRLAANGAALIRRGAAWCLMERGGPEDLPFIREMMKNGEQRGKYAAVAAIAKLGNATDLPLLRTFATSTGSDWPLRRNAVRAIAALGTHADFALLREIAEKDEVSHLVGKTAAWLCWRLATREDIPVMIDVIRRGNTVDVLRRVIAALAAQYSDQEVLAAMAELLATTHPLVARMVAAVVARRTSTSQLIGFMAEYKTKLGPQTLAVFDWHVHAPQYLRVAYAQWTERQRTEELSYGW